MALNGYMKGINIGGWLSQCAHNDEHYSAFFTENDVKTIAEWGLDHIRIPIDSQVVETADGEYKESGFAYLDNCFSWCEKYGLNIILDIHRAAGYAFYTLEENTLFEDEALQTRYIKLWKTLAERYSKHGDRVIFELLNEIVEQTPDRWNKLAHRTIEEIRKIAPTTKILVGGIKWNSASTVKYLDMPYDENIVYNFHFYEPFLFTHQNARWVDKMPHDIMEYRGDIKKYKEVAARLGCYGSGLADVSEMGAEFMEKLMSEAVEIAKQRNVSLYCGEYGVDDFAPPEDTLQWYKDINSVFEKLEIGRAAWTYKSMSFGIADEHYDDVRDELVKAL